MKALPRTRAIFFYYGYYYAARCLEEVAPEHLARHAAHLASDLLPMQEEDGSWWDYPPVQLPQILRHRICLICRLPRQRIPVSL